MTDFCVGMGEFEGAVGAAAGVANFTRYIEGSVKGDKRWFEFTKASAHTAYVAQPGHLFGACAEAACQLERTGVVLDSTVEVAQAQLNVA